MILSLDLQCATRRLVGYKASSQSQLLQRGKRGFVGTLLQMKQGFFVLITLEED